MVNNLIWAAIGAGLNAFLSKTSELEYIGTPGQFDTFAKGLPNLPSQLGFLGFTKMDEALAAGDAEADCWWYGYTKARINMAWSWWNSRPDSSKEITGRCVMTDNSIRLRYACGCIYDLDEGGILGGDKLSVSDFTLCVKHKQLIGPKLVKEKD